MRLGTLLFVLVLLTGAGWLFRYDYLPPTDSGAIETVIVCKANRWTANVTCDAVMVDPESAAREMERWLNERREKNR